MSVSLSSRNLSARPTLTASKSCSPSPSFALIGTNATFWVKSLILSYLSMLNPCSENCPRIFQYLSSNKDITSSLCSLNDSINERPDSHLQPCILSTLFAAITKGVFVSFRVLRLSMVWGCSPSITSMTRIAISATDPPRFLRLTKEWCPGVSINSKPGDLKFLPPSIAEQVSFRTSAGTSVAPMCCVIPPASRSITLACLSEPIERTKSNTLVLPWST